MLTLDKKCEMCGGQLDIADDGKKAVCPYCGSTYSYSKPVTAETAAGLNRANNYRLRNMFDNAIVEYKTLLALPEFEDNAEAYWGLTLSEFGIEYVHDTREDTYVPTCHRTVPSSIFDCDSYKKAIEYASPDMRAEYEKKAAEIDDLQNAIKAQAAYIEDYEVFICFKSTDGNRLPTNDRYIARKIYDELTRRGFRVFFSEVSLKGKLGSDYEPVIYKALTTARAMILVATKEEYINAPFVRNEWSRFLDRRRDDPSILFIPVFGNIDPSALPVRGQGVDLSKYPAGGYEVDIADNLETILTRRAAPKLNDEILSEYSRYNEINRMNLENAYQHAMREVDLGRGRKKSPAREFADKAAEMKNLGGYKNAHALSATYAAQSAEFAAKEKKLLRTRRIFDLALTLVGALFAAFVIIFMWDASIGIEIFDIEINIPRYFATCCIFMGISVGLCFFVSLLSLILSFTLRIENMRNLKKVEYFAYALSCVFMIVSTILYSTDEDIGDLDEAGGVIFGVLFTIITVAILATNIVKNVITSKSLAPRN